MLNIKYIGLVIILSLIIGFFLLRDHFSTPNTLTYDKGVKNLTREKAAEVIKNRLNNDPSILYKLDKSEKIEFIEKLGSYRVAISNLFPSKLKKDTLSKLEKEGYIKSLKYTKIPDLFSDHYDFDLTDKLNPYLINLKDEKVKDKYIKLVELISVEVTGITEPTSLEGKTIRQADFIAKFKLTPIGMLYEEKNQKELIEDIKRPARFILYDDGWRLAD